VAEATTALERVAPQARLAWFGHLGDGNLHFNLLAPAGADPQTLVARQDEINRIVHDLVARYAGSISAEHGLGVLRRDENQRYKSDIEMRLMRMLKQALDPQGLLNPGKMLVA
jgi:FAD/FMN-containing dehydrogenase